MSHSRIDTHTFFIPSLDCPEEYSLIDKGLAGLDGVQDTTPDYLGRSLRVSFDPDQLDVETLAAQLQRIGFPTQPRTPEVAGAEVPTSWVPPIRWTTLVSGVLLLAGGGLYVVGRVDGWLAAVLVSATVLAGWHVAWAAWRALRLRSIDMNVLMMIAAIGATVTGEFFEAATAMFLFAVSLWLESYTLNRARRAVQSLVQLKPATAHRLGHHGPAHSPATSDHDHGHPAERNAHGHDHHGCQAGAHHHVTDIHPSEIQLGDLLLVKPGERVPVDGVVTSGSSHVNEAPLTGESLPVEKDEGSPLFAGALNGDGTLEMRATTTAADSTLAQVARLVEQAQAARSPTERFVDRFARHYTPAVVAGALVLAFAPPLLAAAGVTWLAAIPATEWLHRGLVLLVIACPCALVISTPVTILCGLHQATRFGLLVKGGEFLERAGQIRCVAFDKTGTLTEGRPYLTEVRGHHGMAAEEVLRIAAALEANSEHPLATAIVAAARAAGHSPLRAHNPVTTRGAGVAGEVAGQACFVGSMAYALQLTGLSELPPDLADSPPGTTIVLAGRERRLLGAIYLADAPRRDAQATMHELRALDIQPLVMLTGDSRATAERIARELGIDQYHAELLPADKVRHVTDLVARWGQVAMVGDGVNDAPALAAARLGIALGTQASDTALETADVVSLSPHLCRIADLIRLGRRTRVTLAQNIAFALTIKLGVLLLALVGLGTLWAAVVADVGASMVVVFNGMRLLRPISAAASAPRAASGLGGRGRSDAKPPA